MSGIYDTSVVQGDTLKWAMYLKEQGGTAYNLTGCTLSMQLRKGYYPATLVATYSTYVPEGTSNVDFTNGLIGGISASATGGTLYISFGATYTSQLSSDSTSKYDIQLVSPATNNVMTILRGSVSVLPEVTRL